MFNEGAKLNQLAVICSVVGFVLVMLFELSLAGCFLKLSNTALSPLQQE